MIKFRYNNFYIYISKYLQNQIRKKNFSKPFVKKKTDIYIYILVKLIFIKIIYNNFFLR